MNAQLDMGLVCESSIAWLAGPKVLYSPSRAACQPGCAGPAKNFCRRVRRLCFLELWPGRWSPPLFLDGLPGRL